MPITDGGIGVPAPTTETAPRREGQHTATDDRLSVTSEDQVVLIVENEPGFAQMLLEAARERGLKGIVTSSGVSAASRMKSLCTIVPSGSLNLATNVMSVICHLPMVPFVLVTNHVSMSGFTVARS